MEDEIRQQAQSREAFLATLSHELRNPLVLCSTLAVLFAIRGLTSLHGKKRLKLFSDKYL